MKARHSLRRSVIRAACGGAIALLAHGAALAADITVFSAAAVQVPVTELAERFEKTTGNHVRFEFSTAGGVEKMVRAGSRPDLVINSAERLQGLASGGFVAAGAPRSLGVVRMGVAVRKGGKVPDLSSVEAFRSSLLKADSISYGDPAKGATSGIHFDKVLDRLAIHDAVRGKLKLGADGLDVMKLVADGDAELGVTQISEIMHVKGDTLVGPLPAELQLASNYCLSLGSAAPSAAAAQFAELLVSAEGRARFKHAGFD